MLSKISFIAVALVALGSMEGIGWYTYKQSQKEESERAPVVAEQSNEPRVVREDIRQSELEKVAKEKEDTVIQEMSSYPKIMVEVVNGRTERTIHMGVRKWVWEPSTLRVKQGEWVRLVIHNADVNHPLYIPELGIEAEVPPEGAVIEFEANKKGSFFFLCGTYCGVGHAEMQGTLIVE